MRKFVFLVINVNIKLTTAAISGATRKFMRKKRKSCLIVANVLTICITNTYDPTHKNSWSTEKQKRKQCSSVILVQRHLQLNNVWIVCHTLRASASQLSLGLEGVLRMQLSLGIY